METLAQKPRHPQSGAHKPQPGGAPQISVQVRALMPAALSLGLTLPATGKGSRWVCAALARLQPRAELADADSGAQLIHLHGVAAPCPGRRRAHLGPGRAARPFLDPSHP